MVEFHLIPTKTFLSDLKSIPASMRKRIEATLEKIKSDPFEGRKLTAVSFGQWRWRVGDYRIRYDIVGTEIVLHRVRSRKDIYR